MIARGSPIGTAPAGPVNIATLASKADTARNRSDVDIVVPFKVGCADRPAALISETVDCCQVKSSIDAFTAHERRSAGERINQHPRQRVFSFASKFLFSTASMSTYGARPSVAALDAGFSSEVGVLIAAGWFVADAALAFLDLPRVGDGAVPL